MTLTISDMFGVQTVFAGLGGNLGDREYQTFTTTGFGNIASFTLDGSGGLDNLRFLAVPEPTSLALFGLGLLGTIGLRGARRR